VLAVEKGKYETIEQGITVAIDIYLDALEQVHKEYQFEMYIHPVLPILDITRSIVLTFNTILQERIQKHKSFSLLSVDTLIYSIISSDKSKLKPEYELDGTHIHPHYVPLLEKALNDLLH
jgi:hypothetical protein